MAATDMFLAMILTNAKREDATKLSLRIQRDKPSIEMELLDGSRRALSCPPAEVLLAIIEGLEQGQKVFESSVFSARVESVNVERGTDCVEARICAWAIEHR